MSSYGHPTTQNKTAQGLSATCCNKVICWTGGPLITSGYVDGYRNWTWTYASVWTATYGRPQLRFLSSCNVTVKAATIVLHVITSFFALKKANRQYSLWRTNLQTRTLSFTISYWQWCFILHVCQVKPFLITSSLIYHQKLMLLTSGEEPNIQCQLMKNKVRRKVLEVLRENWRKKMNFFTLLKLKQGLLNQFLADMFQVSQSLISSKGNVNNQFTYCSVEGASVIDAPEVAVVIVNNFVNNTASIVF